jgi:hypothetical protein
MAVQFSFESVKTYPDYDAAARAIECFLLPQGPHGYTYEILEQRIRACGFQSFFRVKACNAAGDFVGYAYCPESEQ